MIANFFKFLLNTGFDLAKETAGTSLAHKLLGAFSIDEKIGPGYENIKVQSDEDNNLFAQLLAKIYFFNLKDIQVINSNDYQDMKTWFETTASKSYCDQIEEVFLLLPETYKSSLSEKTLILLQTVADKFEVDLKYVLLSELYQWLVNKTDEERFSLIRRKFYDNLKQNHSAESAVNEYVSKNPLSTKLKDSANVFIVWSNFCNSLPELIRNNDQAKKILFSYNQAHRNSNETDVIHDFINDFVNCIANHIKIETEKDLTGKKITEETPVVILMKDWLKQKNDFERLALACSLIKAPQHFSDKMWDIADDINKARIALDTKVAAKIVEEGGLTSVIDNLANRIRGNR